MCGFVGSVRWQQPDSTDRIESLLKYLIHRGPDAGHVQAYGPAVFGHRRLSIIDTASHADQPMLDASQRRVIVFNGEIYNFKELRAELQQAGITFKTHSDTEVIIEAWAYWGDNFIEHLVGMFALALWNREEQKLLLARDRAGEKPLFYAWLDDGIVFASELKALRRHPDVSSTINPQAISQYLSLNYVLSDCSILESVHKLAAAHTLVVRSAQRVQPQRYWHLHKFFHNKLTCTENKAKQQLYDLLDNSIAQQSISDVPLGTFLSGGIDSSSITALLARQLDDPQRLKTFSIGFAEDSYSELPEAKHMAQSLNVDHYDLVVHPDIKDTLAKIVYHADEPFADTSMIPTYYLAQMTRKQVTVALSGDGSDEIFAGYVTNTADRLHAYGQHIPQALLKMMHGLLNKVLPVTFDKVSLDYKLKQFMKGAALPFAQAHFSWRQIFDESDKRLLLNQDYQQRVSKLHPFTSIQSYYDDVQDCHIIDQAAYVDFKTWLVDDILVKVDRMSMAHSLETRAPFLDHRLVEFAAQLPVNFKMKGWIKKYILKQAMQSVLPQQTLQQKKKGFNAPVSWWLAGSMHDFAHDVTTSRLMQQWFSRAFIEKLWYEHQQKHADHGLKLFSLTCLGLWLDQAQAVEKVN